ncbi:two-component sensor histidine kinase [Prauserella marina]|uniref:histidine kinase n=1 Tax=Prauserella marina TaxID=530584 RepID=A0A222VKY1_9PSEU|nr:sensor histidine kinase [Prauserella marina]ASR34589.1 two-component sensor histidine kinase [Prauserella marina]PWV85780.1 signal transduction histidine kinase [Prauserella marina]SDC45731.1 Signal transduction histidine kinase [Prauserella marina]
MGAADTGAAHRWRSRPFDAALAASVTVLVLVDALTGQARPGALDYVLLVISSLALVARTRAPRAVLAISLVANLVYTLQADPGPIAAAPALIAVYTVVSLGHRVLGIAVVAPLIVFAFAQNLAELDDGLSATQAIQDALLPVGWFFAVLVLGEVTRHRRAYLRQVEQRAAEAERTREEAALHRASEERLRIARELHDSLTHQISIITVQAGVAVHLARKRGIEVPEALVAVQDASREAGRELRATLEVLRADRTERHQDTGLARLAELVGKAGVSATVTVEGKRRPLPAEVDRAAYRIVQEALTNVSRHAAGASATVHIGYLEGEVTVRVEDDGSEGEANAATTTSPGGVGLIGMRERVNALGGTLHAAPREHGGFRVEATLPTVVTA